MGDDDVGVRWHLANRRMNYLDIKLGLLDHLLQLVGTHEAAAHSSFAGKHDELYLVGLLYYFTHFRVLCYLRAPRSTGNGAQIFRKGGHDGVLPSYPPSKLGYVAWITRCLERSCQERLA